MKSDAKVFCETVRNSYSCPLVRANHVGRGSFVWCKALALASRVRFTSYLPDLTCNRARVWTGAPMTARRSDRLRKASEWIFGQMTDRPQDRISLRFKCDPHPAVGSIPIGQAQIGDTKSEVPNVSLKLIWTWTLIDGERPGVQVCRGVLICHQAGTALWDRTHACTGRSEFDHALQDLVVLLRGQVSKESATVLADRLVFDSGPLVPHIQHLEVDKAVALQQSTR